MTVVEYLDEVIGRLLSDPVVSRFEIIRERYTADDGYLRVQAVLADGGRLEFSEYVQISAAAEIDVVTYSYHWTDRNGSLIQRWDNTPHHPGLPNFPHHVHFGPTGAVMSGGPMSIFAVLAEIAQRQSAEGDVPQRP